MRGEARPAQSPARPRWSLSLASRLSPRGGRQSWGTPWGSLRGGRQSWGTRWGPLRLSFGIGGESWLPLSPRPGSHRGHGRRPPGTLGLIPGALTPHLLHPGSAYREGRRASEFTGGKQRGLAAGSPAGPRSWRGPQSPPGTLAKPAPNLLTNQLELEARSWALQNLKPETELPSPCAWHRALWPSEEWHLSWVCTPASRVPQDAAACPRQNQLHVGSSLTESELPPPTTRGNLTVLGGSPGVREHVLNPLLRTKLAQASTLPV